MVPEASVRTERGDDPEERAAVREIIRLAFGRDDEADLVDALRADASWLPHLTLVAEVSGTAGRPHSQGRIVGHVAATRLEVGGRPAVALAPLAVHPGHQGTGVGTRLVHEQARRARAAGESLVVVLGDPAYYRRFGFVPSAPLGLHGPFHDAGDAFQALVLVAGAAPEGRVTYPAPFGA
ncbi:MAG TPA: N-acetyltransferase [Jiangellales bacterium]|nr:N-acetyltransferase [Jiangellales bacterium]